MLATDVPVFVCCGCFFFLSTHLAMAWMHACACVGVCVIDVLCVLTMMWLGGS